MAVASLRLPLRFRFHMAWNSRSSAVSRRLTRLGVAQKRYWLGGAEHSEEYMYQELLSLPPVRKTANDGPRG
jgi:hypothetical protein